MKKRLALMILAVLLIAALVAGCGKQEAPASNGSTDSEGAEEVGELQDGLLFT